MNIVHISDKHYFRELENYPLISGIPDDVVNLVENGHCDTDLFVININYSAKNVFRSHNCGIQILKLLRLKNFNQHCILYSFLNREQLMMRSEKNLIIFSQGVTYLQIPYKFSDLKLEKLIGNEAPKDLSSYFKAESILPDNRHFYANWWGVWQLWQVQKAIEDIGSIQESDEVKNNFGNAFNEMNSFQGLLARYVYGHRYEDITKTLKAKENYRDKVFDTETHDSTEIEDEIKKIIASIENDKIKLETLSDLKDKIDNEENLKNKPIEELLIFISKWVIKKKSDIISDCIKDIIRLIEEKTKIIENNNDFLKLLSDLDEEKNKIKELIHNKNQELNLIIAQKKSSLSQLSYNEILKNLNEKKPNIVYVDDQAEDGWSFIIRRIIYGNNSEGEHLPFHVLIPDRNIDNNSIAKIIYDLVDELKSELLILDLRLKGEKGSNIDPQFISGIQVLKRLNELRLPCPILIITASNKIRTYKETYTLGATAFWTKEGLDEKYDIHATVDNYLSFVELVYMLCYSEEIVLLFNTFLREIIRFINQERVFWWETKFWVDKPEFFLKSEIAVKKEIINILWQVYEDIHERIKTAIKTEKDIKINERDVSLIVLKLSQILELIHCTEENKPKSIVDKISCQFGLNEFNAQNNFTITTAQLHQIRNNAAHQFNVGLDELKKYIDLLFEYLHGKKYYDSNQRFEENEITVGITPEDGNFYTSKVIKIERNKKIIIENPNLNLENGYTDIVINLKEKYKDYFFNEAQINKGDSIIFKLHIHRKGQDVEGYYGKEAKLIENQ